MNRLRVLALIEALTITGPAKNLLQFAELSPKFGVETVLATFERGDDDNLFVKAAQRAGLEIHRIAERGAFDPAVIGSLKRLARRVGSDILQTHAVKSHFLARLAGLPRTAPWVAFHHGYTWTTWKTRSYNELDRWSLRKANRVLTVSLPFREELVAKGVRRERVEVIHNAVPPEWGRGAREPEHAARLRARWSIPEDAKVVLIVGRLSKEKDHLALIDAVHAIRDEVRLRVLIVGEGPERTAIESRTRTLGISDLVVLTGQQPSAEPFYGIADVAVLSSRTEGSPNALLEAMAAGVPAVATAVGGIPEIVEDGESALLVPATDAPALAEALRRLLLKEPALASKLAANAIARVLEQHTPAKRVERLVSIYRSLADESTCKGNGCLEEGR